MMPASNWKFKGIIPMKRKGSGIRKEEINILLEATGSFSLIEIMDAIIRITKIITENEIRIIDIAFNERFKST